MTIKTKHKRDLVLMTTQPQVEIPKLPSADLIQFRFDRIDDAVSKLDKRVEFFTSTFINKDEAALLISERNEKISTSQRELTTLIEDVRREATKANIEVLKRIDRNDEDKRWLNRKIVGAVLVAAITAIFSLTITLISSHAFGH